MESRATISHRNYWWKTKRISSEKCDFAKLDDQCPACKLGKLDYDSLFILTCTECGFIAENSAFT